MPTLPNINTETHEQFLANEYQNVKALVFMYDEAISFLIANQHASYEIDSGQSKQRVTRLDLPSLELTQRNLLKRLDNLASRLGYNRSVVVVTPGF